jgi:large subunit ribosomal protein L30e
MTMFDMNRALKTASTTGDVRFGLAETKKSIKKSKNCPETATLQSGSAVRLIVYDGTNVELGNACGKPFPISALAVISPGESNILSA